MWGNNLSGQCLEPTVKPYRLNVPSRGSLSGSVGIVPEQKLQQATLVPLVARLERKVYAGVLLHQLPIEKCPVVGF